MLLKFLDNRYSNTYLVGNKNKYCFLFDPSDVVDSNFILKLKNEFKELKAIFLTHGHYDHFYSLNLLLESFPNCKVFIYKEEKNFLFDENLNLGLSLSGYNYVPFKFESNLILLNDLENVMIEDQKIKIFHTPFHTIGSAIYFIKKEKAIISGDTLFKDSIGRSDLPTGDETKINSSLKIFGSFKDEIILCPGHGETCSLGTTRKINPFLK